MLSQIFAGAIIATSVTMSNVPIYSDMMNYVQNTEIPTQETIAEEVGEYNFADELKADMDKMHAEAETPHYTSTMPDGPQIMAKVEVEKGFLDQETMYSRYVPQELAADGSGRIYMKEAHVEPITYGEVLEETVGAIQDDAIKVLGVAGPGYALDEKEEKERQDELAEYLEQEELKKLSTPPEGLDEDEWRKQKYDEVVNEAEQNYEDSNSRALRSYEENGDKESYDAKLVENRINFENEVEAAQEYWGIDSTTGDVYNSEDENKKNTLLETDDKAEESKIHEPTHNTGKEKNSISGDNTGQNKQPKEANNSEKNKNPETEETKNTESPTNTKDNPSLNPQPKTERPKNPELDNEGSKGTNNNADKKRPDSEYKPQSERIQADVNNTNTNANKTNDVDNKQSKAEESKIHEPTHNVGEEKNSISGDNTGQNKQPKEVNISEKNKNPETEETKNTESPTNTKDNPSLNPQPKIEQPPQPPPQPRHPDSPPNKPKIDQDYYNGMGM